MAFLWERVKAAAASGRSMENNAELEKLLPESDSEIVQSESQEPWALTTGQHLGHVGFPSKADRSVLILRDGTDTAEDEGRRGWRRAVVNQSVRRVVSIFCCFLLACTGGFTYTFGNINPYVTSYLRNRTGKHDTDYMNTLWLPETTSITGNAMMPLVGLLSPILHAKLYIALGVVLFSAALLGTYWTIQQSFSLVVFTYGFIFGVGHSFLYSAALNVAMSWIPERKAFVSGVVLMGYGVGPIVWSQLTTWVINTHNLQPDLHVGKDAYFTQAEVLDNVPPCFLLLGIITVSVQTVCLILMCIPPPPPKDPVYERIVPESLENSDDSSDMETETSCSEEQTSPVTGTTAKKQEAVSSLPVKKQEKNLEKKQEANTSRNYHPRDVLKSRPFWTLWFMNVGVHTGTIFVLSLYKPYGQTFISDDHFLALVASMNSVFLAIGRPLWGALADKFGCRMVGLIAQSILACLVATLVTCEIAGRWAFLFWVSAMFFTISGVFTMTPPLIFALYGAEHFKVNIGMEKVNGVVGSVLTVGLAPILKDSFGWHGMFYVGFAGLFASVLLNMSMSLHCGGSIPAHMRPILSV